MSDAVNEERVVGEVHPGVRATAVLHELDTRSGLLACWTFVVQSPCPARLTVLKGLTDGSEPPWALAQALFAPVVAAALRNEMLEEGAVFEVSHADATGVGLLHASPFDESDEVGEHELTLVGLRGDEPGVARESGFTRIAARIGENTAHFPCAPWFDRRRDPVTAKGELERSALSHTTRRREPTAGVFVAGDTVVLRLPRSSAPQLSSWLSARVSEEVVALLVPPARDADALLVWDAGQTDARAIAPSDGEGERVAGGFLVLARGAEEPGANVLEDGFALHLDEAHAARLFECVAKGTPYEQAPGEGALGARIEWVEPRANG